MIADNWAIAREVHALLESARPHADDSNLERAAHLVSLAADNDLGPGDDERKSTSIALQNLRKAIDRVDAAGGENLLLEAIRSAEQWVRLGCSGGDR